ncbi:MAG: hypothetical protein K1X82_07200 [Bacteroidia bacterium]|nr:hypothetical protein [Bacteroidia bacterium]
MAQNLPVSNTKFGRKLAVDLSDSTKVDSIQAVHNQLIAVPEKAEKDTLLVSSDTIPAKKDSLKPKEEKLKSKVEYSARDSIRFEVDTKLIYLYGDAQITYEDVKVNAGYIEINWNTNEITAKPLLDSLGHETELPVMVDAGQTYNSHEMVYNFQTKKGRTKKVITTQGEGKLHGEIVKKIDDKSIFVKNGKYSTCLDDDPHFYIQANKLKVIQNDKIVTGPAFIAFEKVPSPLVVPFGFFPNTQKQKSGLILPQPGSSPGQGFFLRNIGYFIGISDKVTMQITGDIYTQGSFGVRVGTAYKKRYKYSGNLDLSHNSFIQSSKELPDYRVTRNYFVKWKHVQDPKARPNSVFSGEINAGTNTAYTRNVSAVSNVNNFLTNTFKSNISYSKTFAGTPLNLVLNATHDQNTQTKVINVTLPQLQLNMQRVFPFARKVQVGAQKWYEKIGLTYNLNGRNTYSAVDSTFFSKKSLDTNMNYGFQHQGSLSTNFKVLKYFTLTPSINASSRFDFKTITKRFEVLTDTAGVDYEKLITEQKYGFFPNADLGGSVSLTTVVYGMFRFKGKVEAIRHTMTPSITFNYRPDLTENEYLVGPVSGKTIQYNKHERGVYGPAPSGKQGALNFSLMNNLEMKMKPGKKDTTTASKKVKLLDQLGFTGSYNFLADSNRLSDIAMRAVTTLFNGRVGVNYSMNWSPYATNEKGQLTRRYMIEQQKKLLRFTRASLALNFNFNKAAGQAPKVSNYGSQDQLDYINSHLDEFLDFNIPWNISVQYNLNYSRNFNLYATEAAKKSLVTQAMTLSGDFNLTPKWKIQFTSGYDFVNKKMTTSTINIYRDLHCWEIKFNWVPFGQQQSFMLTVQPKAGLLQDLKLTRQRSWFDRN